MSISFMHALLITSMAFPQPFIGTRVYAQAVTPSSSTAQPPHTDMEQLKDFFSAIKEIQDGLSREDFDPLTVVMKVGNDPEALRKWVSDNITLVSYLGHLRSPSAVMMDGSGNGLDRAVLLAHLLELAGHQPRLAMTEVSQEWVNTHAPSAFTEESKVRTPVLPQAMNIPEGISDPRQLSLLNTYINARNQTLMEVARRTENHLSVFSKALTKINNAEVKTTPLTHWWVLSETDKDLIALDPSSAPTLVAKQIFAVEELPEAHKQTVQVLVRVEQLLGGKRSENIALAHTFAAGKDGNNDFQVGFTPKDLTMNYSDFTANPNQATQAFIEQLNNEENWMPYIKYSGETFTDLGFTANGNMIKTLASSIQGDKLNEAVSLLGGLGKTPEEIEKTDASKGQLSRVTLAFILNRPGAEPETTERILYQLKDTSLKAETKKIPAITPGLALASVTDVLMQTSALRRNYVSDKSLFHTLESRNATLGSFYYEKKNDPKKMQESMDKLTVFPQQIYDFALTRFMLNPHQNLLQITQPHLIAFHQTIRTSDQGAGIIVQGFDLIQTEMDILPGVQNPATYRLEQGVVDAALEAVLANTAEAKAFSASSLLDRLPEDQWVWIRNLTELAQLGPLSTEVKAMIENSLAKGEILYVPKDLANLPASQSAWWEMNPESGKVIGRIVEGGWGGSAEYVINLYVAKALIILLGVSIMMCAEDPGFLCIFCSVVSATLILGTIFAPGIGAAAAIAVAGGISNLGCTIGSVL